MPGIPVKLANTVKISARYMAIGSLVLSPMAKAVVGHVGIITASKSVNIASVLSTNSLRTCCALLKYAS